MPYIETKTNITLTKQNEKDLNAAFGKALKLILGKDERWLMLDFCDNQRLWFAGDDAPAVMLKVEILGSASDASYDTLTQALTDVVFENLNIPASRVYIKYDEIDHWGWNSSNF